MVHLVIPRLSNKLVKSITDLMVERQLCILMIRLTHVCGSDLINCLMEERSMFLKLIDKKRFISICFVVLVIIGYSISPNGLIEVQAQVRTVFAKEDVRLKSDSLTIYKGKSKTIGLEYSKGISISKDTYKSSNTAVAVISKNGSIIDEKKITFRKI